MNSLPYPNNTFNDQIMSLHARIYQLEAENHALRNQLSQNQLNNQYANQQSIGRPVSSGGLGGYYGSLSQALGIGPDGSGGGAYPDLDEVWEMIHGTKKEKEPEELKKLLDKLI